MRIGDSYGMVARAPSPAREIQHSSVDTLQRPRKEISRVRSVRGLTGSIIAALTQSSPNLANFNNLFLDNDDYNFFQTFTYN